MDEIKTKTQDLSATNNQFTNKMNLENKKEVYDFVANKIDKLSTAVYMVSSYISDNEPIKTGLRTVALSCVSSAHSLVTSAPGSHASSHLQKDIKHAIALVTLAETMSIMSHMNAQLLINEYQKLQNLIGAGTAPVKSFSSIESHIKDDKDFHFFDNTATLSLSSTITTKSLESKQFELETSKQEEKKPSVSLVAPVAPQVTKTPSQKNPESNFDKNRETIQERLAAHISPINQIQKDKERQPVFKKQNIGPEMKERKSGRQEAILNVLEAGIELSIKDVAKKVRGCSEKTIQRELNTLVEIKKAKRIGEKRWSKYLKI